MDETAAGSRTVCPKCGASQEPAELCAACGLVFAKYRPPVSTWSVEAPAESAGMPDPAYPPADDDAGVTARGVDIVNIIALLFLVDSTLSLLARVPAIGGVLADGTMTFHQKAKFLYDAATSAAMFVSVFGLLMRREWARMATISLLALGLAEGVYMQIYAQVSVSGLEKELREELTDLRRNAMVKWIGCAVYAYFIYRLSSRKVRAGFRRRQNSE